MVEDVYMLSKYIKNKYPNLSLYLFGHSMGSLIVRNYIIKYDSYLDGLIVCGSPSYNRLVGVGKLVCKFLILIKGQRYRSKLMNKLMFGHFNKGFIKRMLGYAVMNMSLINIIKIVYVHLFLH